jgi:hypothetical protein
MSMYSEHKVLSVECPKCGAQPEEYCRSASGKKAHDPHTLRKAVVYPRYLRNVSGGPRQGIGKKNE